MSSQGTAEANAPAQETVVDDKAAVTTDTQTPETEEGEAEETQEGEQPETETEGETAEGAETETGDKPTKSKLRREKQKARITELEESVRLLTERALAADRNKPATTELGPKPDRAKYGDDDAEYLSDLAAWKTEERLIARQTKAQETNSTTARGDAAAKRVELFRERAMALTDRYPDIEAKVFKDDTLPMSATMAETIMESEKGPEIAYHLSTNRELAQRIKSMPPLAAAMELGRIEARLSLPKPRTETKAPPPPPTVKGSTSGPAKKLEDMSMAAYRKARGYD